MPRLKNRPPSYRLHKASGQAIVTLNGRDQRAGQENRPEEQVDTAHEAHSIPPVWVL